MALIPDDEILRQLRQIYKDAFKLNGQDISPTNDQVIRWAEAPETWAQHQIAHHGKTWQATEAVVRACRIKVKRAKRAAGLRVNSRREPPAPIPATADPFDPLFPIAPTPADAKRDAML